MSILFDATTIAPSTGDYEPIPVGRYLLQVTEGEMKETGGGTGSGASVKLQVCEGEYQGRVFSQFFNLSNPNPTATKIGQAEFSALCHATGVLQPRDLSEFQNRPFYADVKVQAGRTGKDGKEYGPSNTIAKYYRADGSDMKGAAASSAPKPATAAAGAAKKLPWEKAA